MVVKLKLGPLTSYSPSSTELKGTLHDHHIKMGYFFCLNVLKKGKRNWVYIGCGTPLLSTSTLYIFL